MGADSGQLCGEMDEDPTRDGDEDTEGAAGLTTADVSDAPGGTFARLRLAGLI